MQQNKLTVIINKPANKVFEFTINPGNTPKWIDGIVIEETNEMPPRLGTIYRNQNQNGNWNECKMTTFEKNKTFTLTRLNNRYGIRYSFKPLGKNSCEFEYYEWVDYGELDDTFSQDTLEKLKKLVEQHG